MAKSDIPSIIITFTTTVFVTVAGALDHETAETHVIEVTATSTDGSTSVQSFTIGVADADENEND